ncbi:MAG: metallophosphoesterase [Gaiella sp.]|nr:metallophosphoesterase [Gaiella sp.]
MGDVHGCRDVLVELLRDAGLVDRDERWQGGDARLWLVGDLTDRGPDGIGAIDLVRRLQDESGGAVGCLLGNHEVLLLSVARFAGEQTSIAGESFHELWRRNGGVESDLRALTPDHLAWITELPPLAREGETLLIHADTTAYLDLGTSIDAVRRSTRTVLAQGSAEDVDDLLGAVSDRMRLDDPEAVRSLLDAYGGSRVVHGHTPIAAVLGVDPRDVTEPLSYCGGLVTNVDHCLFAGGRGFVARLERGERGPGLEARPSLRSS